MSLNAVQEETTVFFALACVCVCVCKSLRILCGENSRQDPYLQGCNPGERARVNEPCLNCHPAFVCVSVSVLCGGLLPRPRAFQHPTQETREG